MRSGAVVLIATPIGNLGDLSTRAADTLRSADLLYCEDTRRTRVLLSAAGIPAGRRLRSLHANNEATRIPEVIEAAQAGGQVAVVTDAGMPTISDPGARLVAACARAGVRVSVVPGPSAVLAALALSGLPTDRFFVEGFLSRTGANRRRRVAGILTSSCTSVVLESARRLASTLTELAEEAPERPVAICRELTKVHEEIWRGTLQGARDEFSSRERSGGNLGEVVIVLAGAPKGPAPGGAQGSEELQLRELVDRLLASGLSPRDAAQRAAAELGVAHRRAYQAALEARGRRPGR